MLNELKAGQPATFINTPGCEKCFEVSRRKDKYEIIDLETEKTYNINVDSVEALTRKDYEDSEALEILTFLKDTLDGILKMSYLEISNVLEKVSEIYPAPEWVIGEIENLTISDIIDIFKSDEPAKKFKRKVTPVQPDSY